MKFTEKTLLALTPENLAETVREIHRQIAYFAGKKIDVEGISLIPVRDLLDEEYTDEMLRNNGYIVTLAQFQEDAEKFLKLASEDPILYTSQLKRLHRSYHVLQDNYAKGMVKNKVVIDEVKQYFAKKILGIYCDGQLTLKKMPETLTDRIAKEIGLQIERLSENWSEQKLNEVLSEEFTELFLADMHRDWQAEKLDKKVLKQLQEENNKLKQPEEILNYFRNKKLPTAIQNLTHMSLVEEILREIQAEKITTLSELGSIINFIKSNSLIGNHADHITKLIENWHNNQTTDKVSQQLENYLLKVITTIKPSLEAKFTQLFTEMTVRNLHENFMQANYSEDLMSEIKKYSLDTAKQLDKLSKCKPLVYDETMRNLHDNWVAGKLTHDENFYIKENTFDFLNSIDMKIQAQITHADMQAEFKELKAKITQLTTVVTEKDTFIAQLDIRMQALENITVKLRSQFDKYAKLEAPDMNYESAKNNNPTNGKGFFK